MFIVGILRPKVKLCFQRLGPHKKMGIISDLVEKKPGLLSEKDLFSWGSANRGNPLWPNGSMPGQKAFASPKKAGGSLFPRRASAVSARQSLCPRVSLRKPRGGNPVGFLPALFGFGACFLARAGNRLAIGGYLYSQDPMKITPFQKEAQVSFQRNRR